MDELDRLSEAKEGLPEVAATMRELEIFRELLDNPQMDLPDTLRKNLVGLREATEKSTGSTPR
jgi:hypothetical protein